MSSERERYARASAILARVSAALHALSAALRASQPASGEPARHEPCRCVLVSASVSEPGSDDTGSD